MEIRDRDSLNQARCVPCEGGVEPCSLEHSQRQLDHLPGWRLTHGGQRIRKDWTVKHFRDALAFFNQVGVLAEAEAHHPDLHLVGYRNIRIEIWTHAIGGLSENDFILASKIDELPLETA